MSFKDKLARHQSTATYPWDDPKAEDYMKKFYAPEHQKTDFKRNQKASEFRDKTISLVISVDTYLTDLEECPEDKDMVLVSKTAVKTMLNEASAVRKLKEEWTELDRLHLSQLVGK